jgi:asparagine synthase (glutamine-hydrolysing)
LCGVVGIFDLKERKFPDVDLIVRMCDSLVHRGPDDEGYLFAPGIGLGHRRLAIIDPAGGEQPMYNEDGSVAVIFNGCIYNFREIKKTLEAAGHVFTTNCDTEVIVHAWEQWGADCVVQFQGMFAFAVWDSGEETLFLARDRLGKKPLYYAELASGRLVFGSELKALLVDPEIPREIDPCAIEEFFAYGYIPDPRTIYRNIAKLPPGHVLLARRGARPRIWRYWDLRFAPRQRSEAQACEELLEHLHDAVSARLVSDVPLGAFLSGGVDSSAVVAAMSGMMSDPVNCFSVDFGVREFDETPYAREVARQFQASHDVDRVNPGELLSLDGVLATYDEPFGDSSAVPTFHVCAAARRHVTVALSGDGGDEQFAGYRRYRWHVAEERVRGLLPGGLGQSVFAMLARVYPELGWAPRPLRAKHTLEELALSPADAYFHSVAVTSDQARRRLFSEHLRRDLQGHQASAVIGHHMAAADTDDALAQALYADMNTWLPGDILTKVDRASMANSLEVRSPFLDHRLVEWAATLPAGLKLHRGTGKYILKRALEPLLPKSILYRAKQGFSMPIADWFRGPLQARLRRLISSPPLLDSGCFVPRELERLIRDHEQGRHDHSAILWLALVFEAFLDGSRRPCEADSRRLGSRRKAVKTALQRARHE